MRNNLQWWFKSRADVSFVFRNCLENAENKEMLGSRGDYVKQFWNLDHYKNWSTSHLFWYLFSTAKGFYQKLKYKCISIDKDFGVENRRSTAFSEMRRVVGQKTFYKFDSYLIDAVKCANQNHPNDRINWCDYKSLHHFLTKTLIW